MVDLGCHVGQGPAFLELAFPLQVQSHAVVDDRRLTCVQIYHDVLRFDVSMYYFSFVDFFESSCYSIKDDPDFLSRDGVAVVYVGHQVAALRKLGQKDKLIVIFEKSPILGNVLSSYQLSQNGEFSEDDVFGGV